MKGEVKVACQEASFDGRFFVLVYVGIFGVVLLDEIEHCPTKIRQKSVVLVTQRGGNGISI